jgi:hypothetical protein
MCFIAAGVCAWLAYAQSHAPFEGPVGHFAPLKLVARESDVIFALGIVSFALAVHGCGAIFATTATNYLALAIGAIPVLQFGLLFALSPSSVLACWHTFWLPLAAPSCAGMAIYFEHLFTQIRTEIQGMSALKYNVQTA